MTLSVSPWEVSLLKQALGPLENSLLHPAPTVSTNAVQHAYAVCEEMTSEHSRTFFLASAMLPRSKRLAMRALYAFCRVSDDIVDRGNGDTQLALQTWRHRILHGPAGSDPVALAWSDTRARYAIPPQYAEQLLDGVAQDFAVSRYATFDDLADYCYRVASTVGLMAMHIVGFVGKEAVPYAIKLGVALQLTNILRDVAEDWRNGRCYLPQDELAAFHITEDDIANGRNDDRWHAFMHFQIARARQLYRESLPGIALLGRQGRFAVAAAAELYQGILDDIETHHYDVFTRRAHLTGPAKLRRLPGIWLRANTNRYGRIAPQTAATSSIGEPPIFNG